MMEAGLAGAVGVGFVAWDFKSFDGTNVNDASRIEIGCTPFATLLGTSPQEGQAFLSEGEYSVKV
jgi:hypothetical protein